MDTRKRLQHSAENERQHARFSWQPPDMSPQEQEIHIYAQLQSPVEDAKYTPKLQTSLPKENKRGFSYAPTPSEHVAFQYISSPSDNSAMPQLPTPIDPRPQSLFMPMSPDMQSLTLPMPPIQKNMRPRTTTPSLPQVQSSDPLRSYTISGHQPSEAQQASESQQTQQSQHTRNLSSLAPLNTNIVSLQAPSVPILPPSHHHQADQLPHKLPITPVSPILIKTPLPLPTNPISPTGPVLNSHEPYTPHGFASRSTANHHAIFSPDAAHGPNGLDFALHQPGQISHPNMEDISGNPQEWKNALCACAPDISTCFTGLFCPCIVYGKSSYRLAQKSAKKDPTDLLSYSAANGHCVVMALSCGLWWLFPMIQRTRLRHLYKLKGGMADDCIKGLCCCCCVAVQNEREIREREEAKRQWAGPVSSEVYKSPGQMIYKPQHGQKVGACR